MKPIGYQIEENDFETLQKINRELFGDGSTLKPDKRRDLANLMFNILHEVEKNQIYDLAEPTPKQVAHRPIIKQLRTSKKARNIKQNGQKTP